MTEKDLEIQELRRQVEKLKDEKRDLRNELCLLCGLYKNAHKGACDDCKYKEC